jgi:hypothetical protein
VRERAGVSLCVNACLRDCMRGGVCACAIYEGLSISEHAHKL